MTYRITNRDKLIALTIIVVALATIALAVYGALCLVGG